MFIYHKAESNNLNKIKKGSTMKKSDVTSMYSKTYLELCVDDSTNIGKVYKSSEATMDLISLIKDRVEKCKINYESIRPYGRGIYRAQEFRDIVYNFREVVYCITPEELFALKDRLYPEIIYIQLVSTIRNTLKNRNQNYTMRAIAGELQSYLDMRSYGQEYVDEINGVNSLEYNPIFVSVSSYFRKEPTDAKIIQISLDNMDILVCRVLGYVNRINTIMYNAYII